jgi:opacity protein-like surface antigen
MKRTWIAGLVALALGFAGTASAAEDDDKQGDVNVFLKGGIANFTGDLGALTDSGPAYGVALNLQPFNVLGFELGYDGSRNDIGSVATATRNGGTAMVKLGLPFIERVKPFVAGGIGASYVSVDGGTGYRNDLMEEIPLAAGLEFNSGAITAGVRGTYRVLLDEDFAGETAADPQGGLFDASLTVGARF